MGLKIRDNHAVVNKNIFRPRLPAPPPPFPYFGGVLERRGSPHFPSSFGVPQGLRLGPLIRPPCFQGAQSGLVADQHYADDFSGGEMSFGSLPVLEDDILNEFLEPTPPGDHDYTLSPTHHAPHSPVRVNRSAITPIHGFLPTLSLSREPVKESLGRPSFCNPLTKLPVSEGEDKKRPSLVTQFPLKERLEGFDFKVSFPSDSPKLVVSIEANYKRIHSVNDCLVAIFFNHSAGPEARVRFLVVFSNDGESTTPVHPCKNHQKPEHPAHIMEVSGVCEALWETSPHPSILVLPCGTNGSLISMNLTPSDTAPPTTPGADPSVGSPSVQDLGLSPPPVTPTSCAQIRFLCRNSCLTRKDLTLICQLERGAEVLARERFLLKVSACPRRDARARKNLNLGVEQRSLTKPKRRRTWEEELETPFKRFPFCADEEDNEGKKEGGPSSDDTLVAMMTGAKSSMFVSAMATAFESLHPEDFFREAKKFDLWWKDIIGRSSNTTSEN